MSGSSGSGLFKKQAANVTHLSQGSHGMTGEIADMRRDIAKTVGPLVAITIEEYTNPPAAAPTAIMLAHASATSKQSFSLAGLNGSVGGGVISPPRNIEVTTAGATPTDAPTSVTVNGLDAQGRVLTETIPGTAGGAATYAGTKCFAKVTSIDAAAGAGTGATFSVGTGAVIGLSQTPKLRAGQAVGLVRQEIVDGALVSPVTGVLTTPATNAPFGAYTPATPPNGVHDYCIEYEYDGSLVTDG